MARIPRSARGKVRHPSPLPRRLPCHLPGPLLCAVFTLKVDPCCPVPSPRGHRLGEALHQVPRVHVSPHLAPSVSWVGVRSPSLLVCLSAGCPPDSGLDGFGSVRSNDLLRKMTRLSSGRTFSCLTYSPGFSSF
jgi:hypothetical protein